MLYASTVTQDARTMTKMPDEKPPGGKPESREMFTEIASLMAAMAKALNLSEADAIAALERGEVTLGLDRDSNGNPFVAATYQGVTARVYQGAIKRETDS